MKRKLFAAGLALALSAGAADTAFAQAKPETLVKQRQAAMTLQGKYVGPLVGMLKGTVPYDANVVARNAGYLEALSKMPWDGFAESTKGQKNTIALPVIWSDAAKFKQAQDQFQSAVAALVVASKSGDEAKVKAAIGDVGKNCGSCHDNFREKQ
jgi:adenylosuccinate lyase